MLRALFVCLSGWTKLHAPRGAREDFPMRLIGFVLSQLAIWLVVSAISAAETKPNVLLFFVDDMGYGELGCYSRSQR